MVSLLDIERQTNLCRQTVYRFLKGEEVRGSTLDALEEYIAQTKKKATKTMRMNSKLVKTHARLMPK